MNKVNTTHFWGQEGKAREYNAKIWGDRGSEWDTTSLQGRFRDDRTAYTNGALSGLHWRLDASSDQLGISRIETIAIPPGETGFLAGTQLVPRGHIPAYGFDKLLTAQIKLAAQILAKAKTFQRPSLPGSGTFDPKPAEVPFQPGSQETWVVVELPEEETIVALQKLCDVPVENFTAFLSPKSKGDRAHAGFKPTKELTLSELVEYLDITKQNYKEQLRRAELKRIEDARIAQEKREAEQRRLEEERKQKANKEHNKQFGRKQKQARPPLLLAGGILIGIIGMVSAFIAFNPFGPSGPDTGQAKGGQGGKGVIDSLQAGNEEVDPKTRDFQERATKEGCTNPFALNFDPAATQDDGSCMRMPTDTLVEKENRTAQKDIVWLEHRLERNSKKLIFGAPSSSASELNDVARKVLATDGYGAWKVFFVPVEENLMAMKIWFSTKPDGDRLVLQLPDALELHFKRIQIDVNYDDRDTDQDGFYASTDQYPFAAGKVDGKDCDNDNIDNHFDREKDEDNNGTCDHQEVYGCMDKVACNYDRKATRNSGCKREDAVGKCGGDCEIDTDDDGVCDTDEVQGCTDPTACNYDERATDDNDSCKVNDAIGVCGGECVEDKDGDGICDSAEIPGCTDSAACNFDEEATDNDDSCQYNDAIGVCGGECVEDKDGDGVCDTDEISGCIDPDACNFNESATIDDNSCQTEDAIGVCGGDCKEDKDKDGKCDD